MSMVSSTSNLPQQLTSFVGRERELAEVARLLQTTRLLTLTGAGGCGKTRLSLEVAARLAERYPDGTWAVELASLSDPDLVPHAVAAALHVREEQDRSLPDTLSRQLHSSRLLLILDNCEHLTRACAALAYSLLRSCPHLTILATSRHALNVGGELLWRVPSLETPQPADAASAESVLAYESVQLFLERARLKRPGFTVTHENSHSIAQLCHRLDGIPLAIELAAARVKVLSVEQIAERLDQSSRILASSGDGLSPRQQTLTALIDWSYNLLPDDEQALLRSLSIFAGGFQLEAVRAICMPADLDEYEAIDLLSQLADKSLIIVEEGGHETRYRMLETIRQYMWEKLSASGEERDLAARHLDWHLQLVERIEPQLKGEAQGRWLERLETEHDNIRVALRHARESDLEKGLRMASALWRFWFLRGHMSEARRWLRSALERATDVSASTRAKAFRAEASLAYYQGDYSHSAACQREALALGRQTGNSEIVADALNMLGLVAYCEGDYEAAQEHYEESLAIKREVADDWGIGTVLGNLGYVAWKKSEYDRARSLYEQNMQIKRELGDKWGVAFMLYSLGLVARSQGNKDEARSLFTQSLNLWRELKHHWGIADCVEGLAGTLDDPRQSAQLFGASEALREAYGGTVPSYERASYEAAVDATRARLPKEVFDAAWSQGRAMSLEEVISLALEVAVPSQAPHPVEPIKAPLPAPSRTPPQTLADGTYPDDLTEREVEVLRLLSSGMSNTLIAGQLNLSVNTVQAHLRTIYSKIGVSSRTEAARYAFERGLA